MIFTATDKEYDSTYS